MSRSSSLILLGVLIVLVPFSGLPSALRVLLTVIFGAIVLGFGIAERAEKVAESRAALTAAPSVPHEISPI